MIGRPRVSPLAPIVASLLFGVSCGQVQTAGTDQPVTIRLSTGFVSGNFRPFSEALAKGYGQLMPDVRIQQVDTTGSLVPDQQAGTAQALYASVTGGIGLGGAMLIAGPLYASYGGRAYWAMAIIAAVALAASLALRRMAQPHSAGSGGETSAPS